MSSPLTSHMMDTPLTIDSIMRHAERLYPQTEIVSVTADNPAHRCTYADVFKRSRKLANVLADLGMRQGDRIATLAWNDYRHMELYYGIQCSGMVCHTINPRLFPEQVQYIVNHAEDQIIFVDKLVWPLVEKLAPSFKSVKHVVILTDSANMPETSMDNVHCYEELLEKASAEFDWPELAETTACALCYTSGTTGNPKGVLYNHRSTVLHAMALNMADVVGLKNSDTILPVVPMFHVNAWGVPYGAPMVGAKLVMPGPKMGDGEALQQLMESEAVTIAMGVPTVWLGLLQYLQTSGKTLPDLERTVVGGAACPQALMDAFREDYGVETLHAWGMTEMSPIGTVNSLPRGFEELSPEEQQKIRVKQGRIVYGVEAKITNDEGEEQAWDGEAFGRLKVRGPWVCASYYKLDESSAHDAEGWFDTGDVANIDSNGTMQITDRAKDVIKSGGEWISSIEVENVAMSHPEVQEAAVIGVASKKWSERPLLIVIPAAGKQPSKEDLLAHFEGKIASWWVPDDVEFVEEIPHTATGKISKLDLRKQFADKVLA